MRQSTHSGSRRTSSGWIAKPAVSKNWRRVSRGGIAAGSEPRSGSSGRTSSPSPRTTRRDSGVGVRTQWGLAGRVETTASLGHAAEHALRFAPYIFGLDREAGGVEELAPGE